MKYYSALLMRLRDAEDWTCYMAVEHDTNVILAVDINNLTGEVCHRHSEHARLLLAPRWAPFTKEIMQEEFLMAIGTL